MQFLYPEIRTQNIIQQKPIWFPDRSGVTRPIWKSKRSGLKNDYPLNPIWNFMRSGSIGQCLRSGKKMRSGNDGDLGRSGNYGDLARSGNRSDLVLAITLKINCSLVDSVPGRTRSPNKHKKPERPENQTAERMPDRGSIWHGPKCQIAFSDLERSGDLDPERDDLARSLPLGQIL